MIFKKYRFTSKLMIAYLLLTVVPMTLLGYISYTQYAKSVEDQVGKYIPRLLDQANVNIDRELEDLQNLPDLIYNSNEVMGILRKEAGQSQSQLLKDRFTVESYLTRSYLVGNYNGIMGVFLASNGRKFQASRVPYDPFDFDRELAPHGRSLDAGGQVDVVLPRDANLRFEGDVPYLLIAKRVIDFDNRRPLGELFLAVDLAFLDRALSQVTEGDSSEVWIMDANGRIVYHKDAARIGERFDEIDRFPILNGSFEKRSPLGGELFSVSQSPRTGWVLAHRIQLGELTSQADRVRNVVVAVFILLVVVTAVISVLLAWNFTKPLNKLSHLMRDVQKGNFDVDLQIRSRDEVGMLALRFNGMVKEIRDLIKENYHIELKQKEAELYALQFQINPHFMYNTLETISMSVEEDEKEKVVEMVTLLGRMLRFSLSNRQSLVPVSLELQHAEDFLRIQKHRFEGALQYEIRCDIDTEQFETPKFVLQPILENGIKYGLENRQSVRIEIEIRRAAPYADAGFADGGAPFADGGARSAEGGARSSEGVARVGGDGAIAFVVRDDGVGMSEERLAQVREALRESEAMQRDTGVGLVNVHSRIRLKFGEPYGVTITSEEGRGTETVIVIPALQRKGGTA